MNTTLATMQVSPAMTTSGKSNGASSVDLYPQGEPKIATDFFAPRNSDALSTKIERGTKWWLAKDLDSSKMPIMNEGFDLRFTDLKQKGIPLFPLVEYREGIVYVVFFKPLFSLWSKVKKKLLGVPDEIRPYYVYPPLEGIQYAPLYHLRHRLAGFEIKAMALATERIFTGTIQFNWSNAGRSEKYIYSYTVKGRIEDPIKFCYFCQEKDAGIRFENEMHVFLRSRIEKLFLQNYSNAGFSERGQFPQEFKFLKKIGYGDTEYEIYYESTLNA